MKLLIGGSPCTHWSIAQTKNRETEPSGIGWDYTTEIDKYAIQTTQHNFPDTIQLGDAFQVREGKVNRRNCMDSTDKILARDFSEGFIQLMKNRILTSHYKYGWICDTYPELADAVACLDQRLALYRESGNAEHLVDVANFAMIEFMRPRHPQAHFKSLFKIF